MAAGWGEPRVAAAFSWPDNSFGGGASGKPRGGLAAVGAGSGWRWPAVRWFGGGGGFSRPRTGSSGNRKSGGFKTGGGF